MQPNHDSAQSVLNLFRGRAKAEDVISHIDALKATLESSDEGHLNVDGVVRSIAVQSLLHIGSRSFSHLLNAIERYLPLLRNLASGGISNATAGGGNPEAKADILTAAAAFWKRNRQMVAIVFDKLMQYQIVDPTDVVAWTFVHGAGVSDDSGASTPMSLDAFEWDLLKAALDKANGRVMIARRKISALRKEDDDTRARAKASGDGSMDVDADVKQGVILSFAPILQGRHSPVFGPDEPAVENPALTTALKAFASLTREQKTALSRALDGFISCLAPSASDSTGRTRHTPLVISEKAWDDRENWGGDEWNVWETWGWYRQFCRAVCFSFPSLASKIADL